MPLLFVGHGNPMNAIEDNAFSRTWKRNGEASAAPTAILSISAPQDHAQQHEVRRCNAGNDNDFGGSLRHYLIKQYPAPARRTLAQQTKEMVGNARSRARLRMGFGPRDMERALADVSASPIFLFIQLSIDSASAAISFELGKQ